MEKVKLPREVVEALDIYYNIYSAGANWMILAEVIRSSEPDRKISNTEATIISYAKETEQNFDYLLKALVNGYEVKQTPVEQAIDWCIKTDCIARGYSTHDVVVAIKHILEKGETA